MKPLILCVDDEKLVLESVVSQLRTHYGNRFVYETAENVVEALEVIDDYLERGQQPAIIISDWLMPITQGDQFLIDTHQRMPESALIMLSGHADEEAVDRAFRYANLHTFIRKPWDKDDLLQAIESILRGEKPKTANLR